MRLLHVVPSYLPAVRYGGPIFATHALCSALVRQGCDVSVFTTNVDGPGESSVATDIPVAMDGVKVWYFKSPLLRRLYYSPAMGRRLEADGKSFDLMHLHSVFLWPTWAAARAARRHRVPYLISPRGMLVKDLIARKSRLAKQVWIAFIERQNLEKASGIHVTSAVESAELRGFGFSLPEVHEVPNGVDVSESVIGTGGLPASAADVFAGERPVVLYVGRISWKKGLDRLIAAMSAVPDAVLLVVGNDEEDYTPKLLELAVQAGVANRVVFAGPVFGPAKLLLFRKAALLALPSYSENFGNVVLESMAEGCPVVVTREVGAAAIVRESNGGLVVDGEPSSLANAIARMLSEPELRKDMGRRGRAAARAGYSWDSVSGRMLQVYRTLVESGRKQAK